MSAARKPSLTVLVNDSWMTPGQHLVEARRLLYVIDTELQDPKVPRSIGDLAAVALAHAAIAVADGLRDGR